MSANHLVLLSGGIDSACLLAECHARGDSTSALFVDYGQAPADKERTCSTAIASYFGAPWTPLDVRGLNVLSGEIPGRNALLAHIALTYLGAQGSSCVYLGIHAGTLYRDCTPEFVAETQRSLDFQSDGRVRLVAPFVTWPKQLVIERGRELGAPLELTHSCECSATPCGACASCIDRKALLASV